METKTQSWASQRINESEVTPFLDEGRDFTSTQRVLENLIEPPEPDPHRIEEILAKSLDLKTLEMEELAVLLAAEPSKWNARFTETASQIKRKVYGNRVVVFAPLYLGSKCVNACVYCGFRNDNSAVERVVLSQEEVRKEGEALAGTLGHRRVTVVTGEHPETDVDYLIRSIQTLYGVEIKTRTGRKSVIRRVSVTAPPMTQEELRRLNEAEIGAYQVFQETYHRPTYKKVHPPTTPKSNFLWRLYAQHRAMAAGVSDVGLGALFGLYDWRYEVLGLLAHVRDLEARFGMGPHNISVPRLEPAVNTPFADNPPAQVSDADFQRIVTILRLAVPYVGIVVTARETPAIRTQALEWGATQMDASAQCAVGGYAKQPAPGEGEKRRQFSLSDGRSLPQFIGDLLATGRLPSFCTAGFRCGRTGQCLTERRQLELEGPFCLVNSVLTFKEWLDDFGPEEMKPASEKAIHREMGLIRKHMPQFYPVFKDAYDRLNQGESDLYF